MTTRAIAPRVRRPARAAGDPAWPSWSSVLAAWLFGLLLLAAVITTVVHVSELERFGALIRQLRPSWLLTALMLQALTYVCAAAVWWLALGRAGHRYRLLRLVPASLAMLFANQAFPTAGLSGSFVVVGSLQPRGVPSPVVMGALIVGLITTYIALLLALVVSAVLLRVYHAVDIAVLLASGALALAAVGVPAGSCESPACQ
jgi:uncharacterized membrane protein YbhN (UPF0104 family)